MSPSLKSNTVIATLVVLLLTMAVVILSPAKGMLTMVGKVSILSMDSSELPAEEPSLAGSIIIGHNAVDAAVIPQVWLDQARVLDTLFTHKSIGSNILDGIADLQVQNPDRYSINVVYGTGSNAGITHYQVGSNQDPQSKINGFEDLVRSGAVRDVAFMKLCVGDFPPWASVPPDDVWVAYRDMMESLQEDYPDTVFVWWTAPLTTQSDNQGNEEKSVYNALVRSYVEENGGVLFDIADIESHDLNDNPVIGPTGHEAMYNDYSSDGAHLNETGRQRVARAMWWLLARIAGWTGVDNWISVASITASISVYPGDTAVYTLATAASEGFTTPITLTLQGEPSGTTASFAPNPVIPPGISQLHITTTASTTAGIYTMTVNGTSGVLTETANLTLIVASAAPSFTIGVSPTTHIAKPNQVVSCTTSVTGANDFSQPVSLTVVGLPTDVSAAWSVNPVTPDNSAILILSIFNNPPFGKYLLQVVGIADEQVVPRDIELVIIYPFRVYLPIVLK